MFNGRTINLTKAFKKSGIPSFDKLNKQKIEDNKNKPRTKSVFVTIPGDFTFFWRMFKRVMKSKKGYFVNEGLDPNRPGAMGRRMKVLLSTGIYNLMEKWDNFRVQKSHDVYFCNNNTSNNDNQFEDEDDESVPEYAPLSFSNSNICLFFYLFLTVLLCNLLILSIVSFYNRRKRLLKALRKVWLLLKTVLGLI